MYAQWFESDDTKNADGAATRAIDARASARGNALAPAQGKVDTRVAHDLVARTHKSYYRRFVMRAWGSMEWLHATIALGQLPADFVASMRWICSFRKSLATAQGNPTPPTIPPRQLKRGERQEPERGNQHKTSEAKRLHEKGKLLDKQVRFQEVQWESGNRRACLSWHAWTKLQDDADIDWAVAYCVSYEAGFPFTDREGSRHNDGPRDLVGLALREWTAAHGLNY